MDGPHLIYFADPMCSWCWGFAPVIEAVETTFGDDLPIRLVMGGLRPGTREPMTDTARAEVRAHWRHVREASGQPFGEGAMDAPGFIYDTDPAARAVVLARRADAKLGLICLHRLQEAFYARGWDVTTPAILGDLAADLGLDREAFLADLASQEAKEETWRDYALSQNAGVTGFPTLICGPGTDGVYAMISRGFNTAETVLAAIARRLAAAA